MNITIKKHRYYFTIFFKCEERRSIGFKIDNSLYVLREGYTIPYCEGEDEHSKGVVDQILSKGGVKHLGKPFVYNEVNFNKFGEIQPSYYEFGTKERTESVVGVTNTVANTVSSEVVASAVTSSKTFYRAVSLDGSGDEAYFTNLYELGKYVVGKSVSVEEVSYTNMPFATKPVTVESPVVIAENPIRHLSDEEIDDELDDIPLDESDTNIPAFGAFGSIGGVGKDSGSEGSQEEDSVIPTTEDSTIDVSVEDNKSEVKVGTVIRSRNRSRRIIQEE